jgi:hypothetical protein
MFDRRKAETVIRALPKIVLSVWVLSAASFAAMVLANPRKVRSLPSVPSPQHSPAKSQSVKSSQAPSGIPSTKTLRQFASGLLAEAEQAALQEPLATGRTWALQQVGSAWRSLDPMRARRLLERAWKESEKIQEVRERSAFQQRIVLPGWAGLDVTRASILAKQIQDSHWRESALKQLAKCVAIFDAEKGVPLLNAIDARIDREQQTLEAAFSIMREEPARAVDLILKVEDINHERLLYNVIGNLAEDDLEAAKSLLPFLRSQEWQEPALLDVVRAMAREQPQEATRLAEQIRTPDRRALAFAAVAAGYRVRDFLKAREAAEEAFRAVQNTFASESRFWLAVQVAPLLGAVDSENTRELLESAASALPQDNKSLRGARLLDLAGAWAAVDVARAESLFQEALQLDESVCVGPHGRFLRTGFDGLIKGLALKEPERAALVFKEQAKKVGHPDVAERKILADLRQRETSKALKFAEALGGAPKREELEQQVLADQARANPSQAERFLSQIKSQYDREEVAGDIAVEMANTDLTRSRRIAKFIQKPSSRSKALWRIGRHLLRKQSVEALAVFREAAAAARQAENGFRRATTLVEVAKVATAPSGSL